MSAFEWLFALNTFAGSKAKLLSKRSAIEKSERLASIVTSSESV